MVRGKDLDFFFFALAKQDEESASIVEYITMLEKEFSSIWNDETRGRCNC